MEQAGFDRNLFENASNKHRYVDVAYPEYVAPLLLAPTGLVWCGYLVGKLTDIE